MEDDDAAAAGAIVERVLGHDLLARARRADARGACRRETPVTLTLEDGTLVEGVVDLAFEEDGGGPSSTTRRIAKSPTSGEEQYRRQLTLYASAIERATGQPATAVLVRI